MKVITILFIFILNNSFSQLNIMFNGSSIDNGDTISDVYYGAELPMTFFTSLSCKNNTDSQRNVFVKCDKTSLAAGTEVRMCWGGTCYGPALDQTLDTVLINSFLTKTGFESTYYPNDLANTSSIIKFTFVDQEHLSDSAWVYCRYGIFNDISFDSLGQAISADIDILNISSDYKIEQIYNSSGQIIANSNYMIENELYYYVVLFKGKRVVIKYLNQIK